MLFFHCRYVGGLMFLMYKLPFVECLMFGALISATDPVTVLAIFQVLLFFYTYMVNCKGAQEECTVEHLI